MRTKANSGLKPGEMRKVGRSGRKYAPRGKCAFCSSTLSYKNCGCAIGLTEEPNWFSLINSWSTATKRQ
jgi:hypothetical protein